MIFAVLSEAADKGELLLVTDGLCRFHLRRDGIVVIRELLVLPFRRGTGVGRRLVGLVRAQYQNYPILAKCPAEYESNGFWRHLGFVFGGEINGINSWLLSSTAQVATPPSGESPPNPVGSMGPDCPIPCTTRRSILRTKSGKNRTDGRT